MYHPVTTEVDELNNNINQVVDALFESGDNYVVIYPNNDNGHNIILKEFKRFNGYDKIKCFPSIRFEYFIEILKGAKYLIGNSSAGIHEAPVIGLPSVNIGSRQKNRFIHETIINCDDNKDQIISAIKIAKEMKNLSKTNYFGDGNSKDNFLNAILSEEIWEISRQKVFNDISI